MKKTYLWNLLGALLLSSLLAACGGGSGGPNGTCVNIDPTRSNALPSCGSTSSGGTSTGGGTSTATASLALSLVDSSGNSLTTLSPGTSGTLKASLKDALGNPVANTVVTFTSTDDTAVWTPATGTALTDANGQTMITLASGTKAGAFSIKASATVGTASVTASAGYSVSFPVLTMSDIRFAPTTVSAFGSSAVSVTVLSGGNAFTPAVSVSFSSPCSLAGKAAIISPVSTQNGIATASYTDKGCGTADPVTATAMTPSGTITKTGTITVLQGSAASLMFVGVSNANIALKGTGGPGRPEFSTVTFKALDNGGVPIAGQNVSFTFADTAGQTTTSGGLTLSPTVGVTAADGTVSTTVASGTMPTSIRVIAASGNMTTISSILVVSSGVPDQKHFSLAATIGNCEGWTIDHLCSTIWVTLGDHFSNPPPDGTAVNFSTSGGVIDASCLTVSGRCSVNLYSSAPRPPNGRVVVLAYALGEETFIDNNGNNVYDAGDAFFDKSPNIYRDDNESGSWTPGEPCIGPASAACNTPGDNVYNGVLRAGGQIPSAQTLYVSAQLVVTFSSSQAIITLPASMTCSPNATIYVPVNVKDVNNLMMPALTNIAFSAQFGLLTGTVKPSSLSVPNVPLAVGQPVVTPTYSVAVTCPPSTVPGTFYIEVTTPAGVITDASMPIN